MTVRRVGNPLQCELTATCTAVSQRNARTVTRVTSPWDERLQRQLSVYSAARGSALPSHVQGMRDSQKIRALGTSDGTPSSEPAGTTTSRPLRVRCGNFEPQTLQKSVAKLFAVSKSNRLVSSSPAVQANCVAST
jgi:hypothetical protein